MAEQEVDQQPVDELPMELNEFEGMRDAFREFIFNRSQNEITKQKIKTKSKTNKAEGQTF